MPESLNTRKKLLKTLQLTDYATLIEDLNYNFSVLLSSPLFVGVQGEPGVNGTQGPAGIRGSKWLFASLDKFREQWPNDNLQGEYQINLDYLNKKLLNDEDRNKLLIATGAGDLFVDGDAFVSNSKIYVLDLSNNRFIDTNQTINNSSDAYQDNLQKYIQQVVNDTLMNNPVYMGLIQTIDFQYAQAKNYTDSSGNVNNKINENSMLDVKSTSSKDGIEIETHKMFLPSGNVFDDEDNLTLIVGGAEMYHKIIQGTLAFNEKDPISNTVSKFGPTYGNPPAQIILQNTQTNGVMIGYKKASKFTDFAKYYVNDKGGFVLSSPNISDHYLKFSEIILYNDNIVFNSDNFIFNGDASFKKLSFNEISSKYFNIKDKTISIGDTFTETHINGNKVFFDGINKNNFACINNEHKLVASPYDVSTNTDITTIPDSITHIPTMKLIKNLYDSFMTNADIISSLQKEVELINDNANNAQTYLEKRIVSTNGKYGKLPGEITQLYIENPNKLETDELLAQLFYSTGKGRENAFYYINGNKINVDLSSFILCNGINNAPQLNSVKTDNGLFVYIMFIN